MKVTSDNSRPTWLSGPVLRKRWGDGEKSMPNSTFHDRRSKNLIPKPEFPFGPATPYWRVEVIEEFENRSATEKAGA